MSEIISVEEYRKRFLDKNGNKKGNKLNARKTFVEEVETDETGKQSKRKLKFDSGKEAKRYKELKLMEKTGLITGLSLQVKFKLEGGSYTADFVYFDCEKKTWIIEDAKGYKTDAYKRSKKAMKERYGIEVVET